MQTPRRFLDYIVDDESLYERHGHDLVSCLGWFVPDEDERAAQRLLLNEAPDVEDRVSIYVCPEDGDVHCGALTTIIDRQGDQIVWRDIAHSTFDWLTARWDHNPLPASVTFGLPPVIIGGRSRIGLERRESGTRM